jgi:hypothetical protein
VVRPGCAGGLVARPNTCVQDLPQGFCEGLLSLLLRIINDTQRGGTELLRPPEARDELFYVFRLSHHTSPLEFGSQRPLLSQLYREKACGFKA